MKTLKHTFIFSLALIVLFSCDRSDVDINDSKRYIKFLGSIAEDEAFGFTIKDDGGFLITGTQDKLIGEGGSLYLASIDANGNYTHTLVLDDTVAGGEVKNSEGHDVASLPNGNFLVLGECTAANDTIGYLVMEVDEQLNIISRDTIFDSNLDIAGRKIVSRVDGEIWLSGESIEKGSNDLDLYYVIRNSDGTYGSQGALGIIDAEDMMGNVIGLSDNSTIWCGTNKNTNESSLRTFKLNESGGILYDFFFKKFNGLNEHGYGVVEGSDGNLYHVGDKEGNGYMVITQPNGVLLNEFTISDPNGDVSIRAIASTSNGKFVMTGVVSTSENKNQIFLYRINSSGKIDLRKYYGGVDDDQGTAVMQMNDGGYAILGTSTIAVGNSIMVLIRTDANGEVFGETF